VCETAVAHERVLGCSVEAACTDARQGELSAAAEGDESAISRQRWAEARVRRRNESALHRFALGGSRLQVANEDIAAGVVGAEVRVGRDQIVTSTALCTGSVTVPMNTTTSPLGEIAGPPPPGIPIDSVILRALDASDSR
jgi:hypothetical protein